MQHVLPTVKAHFDFETGSPTDLNKSGVHRYAEDPFTRIWGFRWRIGETGLISEWRPGFPDPAEFLTHIYYGGLVVAHNATFERTMWNMVLRRICPHWPELRMEQQDCTMARAATIAHPMALGKLCEVLNTPNQKDMIGHNIMMKMAKPRGFNADGTVTWWDDADLWNRNMAYCGLDVATETDIDGILPQLSDRMRRQWLLDQKINERGVLFDINAAKVLTQVVDVAKKEADVTMRQITGREVPRCTNVGKLMTWLNANGIECETLKKGDQDDLMYIADLHGNNAARDAIELRKSSSKTSTAKYSAMVKSASADNRIRFLLAFHAASTGRWGGRLVQPQNFPRVDSEDSILTEHVNWLHRLIQAGYNARQIYDLIAAVHGPLYPLQLLSKALRSMIMAAPGKKLVGGDFANIEGRVNAWLANETWKLKAFADYDAGIGDDLYKLAYARSFGVPVETVFGQKRQIGKVEELALGYQGSVGAFITMGDTYGLDPYMLTAPVRAATTPETWAYTESMYKSASNKLGLKLPEWTALKVVVDAWRMSNSAIVAQWWAYQDAAIEAVAAPGNVIYTASNRVGYYSDGKYLWTILPSKRMLCYSQPELEEKGEEYTDKFTGEVKHRLKRTVWFWGTDSKTKQWKRRNLYGGLQCENIVQATSMDIMFDAMERAEDEGFELILTVHDELLAECDINDETLSEASLQHVMSIKSPEYEGLPIASKTWEDQRYVK